jgi:hypothetical protein
MRIDFSSSACVSCAALALGAVLWAVAPTPLNAEPGQLIGGANLYCNNLTGDDLPHCTGTGGNTQCTDLTHKDCEMDQGNNGKTCQDNSDQSSACGGLSSGTNAVCNGADRSCQ